MMTDLSQRVSKSVLSMTQKAKQMVSILILETGVTPSTPTDATGACVRCKDQP